MGCGCEKLKERRRMQLPSPWKALVPRMMLRPDFDFLTLLQSQGHSLDDVR
jgi:hypothetical protein